MKLALAPRTVVSLASLLLAAGCGGHSALPASGTPLGNAHGATLKVIIKVARPTGAHRGRHPRWVSPASQSVSISLAASGGGTPAVFNINLGSNCTTATGSKTCSETLSVNPGTYMATVSTYDAPNEGGQLLSHGENMPANVKPGKANVISLTLGGVPHSIAVAGSGTAVRGSIASGFTVYDGAAQLLTITAQDADGNTIVGAGTPWAGTVSSGHGWTIEASPSPAHPNSLAVTPPNANGSAATLKIAAKYDNATCSTAGVVCSVSFNATNDVQFLAVSDCQKTCANGTDPDAVFIFQAPYTGYPTQTITKGVYDPLAVAISANGTIFVANCGKNCGYTGGDSVTVYAPPYTATPTTITSGILYPQQIAVNAAGDLFVDNCNTCLSTGNDVVTMYSHSNYAAAPVTLSGFDGQADGLAVDPAGDFLLAACNVGCSYNYEPDEVLQYAPNYGGSPTAIVKGIGFGTNNVGMAFDAAGDLFVPDCINCSASVTYQVTKYVAPYSGAGNPAQTISSGMNTPLTAAFDATNDLFVANAPGGSIDNVSEYAPMAYSQGTRLFGGSYYAVGYPAYQLAVDALGDVIMSDGASVQLSPPPYTDLTDVQDLGGSTSFPFALSP